MNALYSERRVIWILAVTLLVSCNGRSRENEFDETAYRDSVEAWHVGRVKGLTSPTGWLNLAGLFWLKDGFNTFGSNPANDLVFPAGKIPAKAGAFVLRNGSLTLEVSQGVQITLDSVPVKSAVIYYPDSAYYPVMRHDSLLWFVIRRDRMLAIRLRDLGSPAVEAFTGIERFALDTRWRLPARVEPHDEGRTISITNVVGQTTDEASPGTVVFAIDGEEYRIDALDGGPDELYLIFGDATNGVSTYPAGRYLYIPRPDREGRTVIDFNKAYNPPCAFTDFATCPLPPSQNVLPLGVTAGEKVYHIGGH
jgi:hypothetical protein